MRAKDLVFLSGCTMLALYGGDFSLSACLLKFFSLGISLCSDYANFTAKANASALPWKTHFQTHTDTDMNTQHIVTLTDLQMAYCTTWCWSVKQAPRWQISLVQCLHLLSKFRMASGFVWCDIHTQNKHHSNEKCTQFAFTVLLIRSSETFQCCDCADVFLKCKNK